MTGEFICNTFLFHLFSFSSYSLSSSVALQLSHYLFHCIYLFTPFIHSLSLCMDLLESHLDNLIQSQKQQEITAIFKLLNSLLHLEYSQSNVDTFIIHRSIMQKNNGTLETGIIGKVFSLCSSSSFFDLNFYSFLILRRLFNSIHSTKHLQIHDSFLPNPKKIPPGGSSTNFSSIYLTVDNLLAFFFLLLSKLSHLMRSDEKYEELTLFSELTSQIEQTKKLSSIK